MSTALWVVQWLLAVVFALSGGRKIVASYDAYTAAMPWAKDFTPGTITTIGVLEVLAALGLTAAPLTGIAPVLAPTAAVGLALLMVGAVRVHARRRESGLVAFNLVLLALSVFTAAGRFGFEPF